LVSTRVMQVLAVQIHLVRFHARAMWVTRGMELTALTGTNVF
jgi:hypothetical protein